MPECPVPPAAPRDQARALPRLQRPTPHDLLFPLWPLPGGSPQHRGLSGSFFARRADTHRIAMAKQPTWGQ